MPTIPDCIQAMADALGVRITADQFDSETLQQLHNLEAEIAGLEVYDELDQDDLQPEH